MPDAGTRATDGEMARLKREAREIYMRLFADVREKAQNYVRRFEAEDRAWRDKIAAGKATDDEYKQWLLNHVYRGQEWEARKREMADAMYTADVAAMDHVNNAAVRTFAKNANATTMDIGYGTGMYGSFRIYDENAVNRIIDQRPALLPPRKKVGRNSAYKWYNRQMDNVVAASILRGENIFDIAARIGMETGETNMAALMRNARTSMTGAQNAGRMDGLHQAQAMGIKVKKRWLATSDDHTRDAHLELDGVEAEVDEPFTNEIGDIMYPGDPDADPANVWNCRCTLTYVYDVDASLRGD